MARYTGPKDKISRRFGVALFGPSKALERRNFPPGQHGVRAGRRKKSDYAVALGEKQKLRFQYGVLEKQFRAYYAEASRRRGITGDLLLQILELRLDNVCYRLGLGNTRSAARQLVNHGHIQVNGKRVDIPSYQCKPGDVISVQDKASSQQLGLRYMDLTQAVPLKDWLELDRTKMEGTITRTPENDDMDAQVNVQLVVELYSR
ncbi:30S ribosomal protein S4 [Verrucomicrobiaceae bacterium R5-34]|uniref:Small ribosomal subunit protein uS4 n=1 Tax=Oceaniferula flava TaxID=2800421 RepID=A0AAE2VAJ4_9BACT|nr:30S ribosomal protein S4 [Oceaniferula flavus]MBK1829173.1 30S ribosomal protein S4 [Verrucomicrobiaceae bacterium R5-34]MBK1853410.1 30S ribosomal protein S4 [Oceaniferula flavus]MBM1134715.1 30S ribosomal protein S4 [Oceaniferula flavus]